MSSKCKTVLHSHRELKFGLMQVSSNLVIFLKFKIRFSFCVLELRSYYGDILYCVLLNIDKITISRLNVLSIYQSARSRYVA